MFPSSSNCLHFAISYDFTLPGRKNTIADCLSRIGKDLKKEDFVKFVPPQKLYDEKFILPISEMQDKNWTVYSLQLTPTDAADVNPLRRSSRIAERRAKLEQLTKSTKDFVTNRTDENNIQIDDDRAPDRRDLEPAYTPTSIPIFKPNFGNSFYINFHSKFRGFFPR